MRQTLEGCVAGTNGLAIDCRLLGVTGGRLSGARSSFFGLIKAALRSFERRGVNGMY